MAKLCVVSSPMLVDDMVKVGGEKEASWDSERRNSIPWGFGSCFPRRRRSASVRHTVRDVKAAAVASGACHTKECLLLCAFSNYGLCENCKMEAVLFQTMVFFSMYGSNIIYVEANLKALKSPMVMNKVVQRNRSERLICFLLASYLGAMHIHVVGTSQCARKSFRR